jgi:GH35 family endo-1,4-beta-xylanase
MGELIFKPQFVQKGVGPHLLDWAYASDENWDAFHSNITSSDEGVKISDTEGKKEFGIDVRWNVEGFGYIYITADNGGEFYELPGSGQSRMLNLNFELAKSRVLRNRRRVVKHSQNGWTLSHELKSLLDLSEDLFSDAQKVLSDDAKCGELSQRALYYAMTASEKLELEKAEFDIAGRGFRNDFFFGCDGKSYFQMSKNLFMERFAEVFNYGMITYVVNGDAEMGLFEPNEGELNFAHRDLLFQDFRKHGITVTGRPLFWFHGWVTPDWLRQKSYDELLKYVEKHTRDVINHYGDGMYAWEVVNEIHDWANAHELTPEQNVELTKFACDVARDAAPKVHRMINNCCPYAEYVQLKQWAGRGNPPAKYPQRTPWQFTRDCVEAGVDFTLLGQQMYFPYRDLQDIIILLERFEQFGKPLQLSEVGVSSGPTEETINNGRLGFPAEPHIWRRPRDEELQADWMEAVYTLAYSKPFIEAAVWFDFLDTYAYIRNGGFLRSGRRPEKKPVFNRLLKLQEKWKR